MKGEMVSIGELEPLDMRTPYRTFKQFCEVAFTRCSQGKDMIFGINGPRGSGKSTAGVCFLREYNQRFFNRNFGKTLLHSQMVSDPDLFKDRVYNLPIGEPIVVDEGVLIAYVGDHASRDVKELIKLFTVCRTKHRAIGLIAPDVGDVVKKLTRYMDYRVRVVDWGLGVIYARDQSEGARDDPFHLKELADIEGYHDSNTPVENIVRKLRKHPCFKDVIEWPDLPVEVREAYEEYRDEMTFGKQTLTRANDAEKLAMVYHNLSTKWESFIQQKKLSQVDFVEVCCKNPVTQEPFWKTRTHLSEGVSKITRALKRAEELKPELVKGEGS